MKIWKSVNLFALRVVAASRTWRQGASGQTEAPDVAVQAPLFQPTIGPKFVGALLAALVALVSSAHAQSGGGFHLSWSTIDGGGGPSTGAVYSVSGTIGQPDAGTPMTGGNYSVTGGFWSLYAVQTTGAPLLSIARTTTNTVAVFWPSPSTGYQLQQNTNSVGSVNWSDVVTTPVDDGTTKSVIINPPTGNRLFRLWKP